MGHGTRRKQRGGRYINHGSYGCGFRPALRCEGEATRRRGKFAKLTKKKTAYTEMVAMRTLRPLDPHQRFFLYPETICKPAAYAPEDRIADCPHDYSNRDEARVIINSKGGLNLAAFQPQPGDYPAFFRSLVNIFDGLEILHTGAIGHNDVKLDNIVTRRMPNGEYHTRLIDFGLMIDAHALRNQAANPEHMFYKYRRLHRDYIYWGFEIRLVDPRVIDLFIDNPAAGQPVVDHYNSNKLSAGVYVPYKSFQHPLLTTHDVEEIAMHIDTMPMVERFMYISSMSDVLSLGLALAEVYYRLTGHRDRGGAVLEIAVADNFGPDARYSRIEDATVNYTATARVWHATVRDRVSIPLYNLIRQMIHSNVLRRISLVAARAQFLTILPHIQALFTEVHVLTHINQYALTGATYGTPVNFAEAAVLAGRAASSSPGAAAVVESEEAAAIMGFEHSPLIVESSPFRRPGSSNGRWYEVVRNSRGRRRTRRMLAQPSSK